MAPTGTEASMSVSCQEMCTAEVWQTFVDTPPVCEEKSPEPVAQPVTPKVEDHYSEKKQQCLAEAPKTVGHPLFRGDPCAGKELNQSTLEPDIVICQLGSEDPDQKEAGKIAFVYRVQKMKDTDIVKEALAQDQERAIQQGALEALSEAKVSDPAVTKIVSAFVETTSSSELKKLGNAVVSGGESGQSSGTGEAVTASSQGVFDPKGPVVGFLSEVVSSVSHVVALGVQFVTGGEVFVNEMTRHREEPGGRRGDPTEIKRDGRGAQAPRHDTEGPYQQPVRSNLPPSHLDSEQPPTLPFYFSKGEREELIQVAAQFLPSSKGEVSLSLLWETTDESDPSPAAIQLREFLLAFSSAPLLQQEVASAFVTLLSPPKEGEVVKGTLDLLTEGPMLVISFQGDQQPSGDGEKLDSGSFDGVKPGANLARSGLSESGLPASGSSDSGKPRMTVTLVTEGLAAARSEGRALLDDPLKTSPKGRGVKGKKGGGLLRGRWKDGESGEESPAIFIGVPPALIPQLIQFMTIPKEHPDHPSSAPQKLAGERRPTAVSHQGDPANSHGNGRGNGGESGNEEEPFYEYEEVAEGEEIDNVSMRG